MISMEKFGRQVADIQDEIVAEQDATHDDVGRARQMLFGAAHTESAQRRGVSVLKMSVGISLLATAAAVMLFFAFGTKFSVPHEESSAKTVAKGEWISASDDASREIRFADGSVVTLEPGASARMLSEKRHGAHVVVEQGRAHVNVVHFSDTEWMVDVGPYTVNVVGTVFEVSWNAGMQEFSLTLVRGKVWVKGPMMEEGRTVQERETLIAQVSRGHLEILAGTDNSASALLVQSTDFDSSNERTENHSSTPAARDESKDLSRRSERHSKTESNAVSWSRLNRDGQFARVLEEANAPGMRKTLETRNAPDLLALGDAARLQKSWVVSEDAYKAVHSRFIGSQSAATASYALGRMAFDNQRDYRKAILWLERYLAVNTTGILSREALGRLMEARSKVGDKDGAHRAASRYLVGYPDGPHAPLANTLVNSH